MPKRREQPHPDGDALRSHMSALRLPFMLEHHQDHAQLAADKHWSHLDYLTELVNGEAAARNDRRVQRCIAQARFPVLKTLDQFDWTWPTKINRLLVQNLFHLDFVHQRANVVFISGTGLGKSHLMTALGHAACQRGHSVLFTGAIEIINTLAAAHASGNIKRALHRYVKPEVLAIDLCAKFSDVESRARAGIETGGPSITLNITESYRGALFNDGGQPCSKTSFPEITPGTSSLAVEPNWIFLPSG